MAYANTSALSVRDLVRAGATVPFASTIAHVSTEVAKTIPLRTSLRIEAPYIVPSNAFVVGDWHNLVLSWESIKACTV